MLMTSSSRGMCLQQRPFRRQEQQQRPRLIIGAAAPPSSSPFSEFQETFKKAMEKRRWMEQERVSSLQELHDSASSAIKLMYAREMEFVSTLCPKKKGDDVDAKM